MSTFLRKVSPNSRFFSSRTAIGIAGGVGPMAGCLMHRLVIENTLTHGRGDHAHLDVYHHSKSRHIADRTKYLESLHPLSSDSGLPNPAEQMVDVVCSLYAAANCDEDVELVVGVPCNTFHAPAIWNEFEVAVADIPRVRVFNMLESTALILQNVAPNAKKIGVMSTSGTRRAKIFEASLQGYEILQVQDERQSSLHGAIYDPDWGLKAVSPVSDRARKLFLGFAKELIEMGADAIILGCTEIPLALPEKELYGVPLVDPMLALARRLVENASPSQLKML